MNSEDTEQLKQFERRPEPRPGLGQHLGLGNKGSKPWLWAFMHATWYVLLVAAAVSTIYHLLVI